MVIRDATPLDASAVRAVLVETWHATYDDIMGPQEVTRITDDWHAEDRLRRQAENPDAVMLVAEVEGQIVGTTSGRRDPTRGHVGRLYVLPAHHGAGVGSGLLRALRDRLGPGPLRVAVHEDNAPAIAFYARQGFVAVGPDGEGHLVMDMADGSP